MRKDNYQDFQGNDQYEGFCVDMLREVAEILKFSFKIKLVDDGLYGAPEPNGSWTGMVGELINRVSVFPQTVSLSVSDTHMYAEMSQPVSLQTE